MKIRELIEELAKVPEERLGDEISVYVNGRVSGILAIDRLESNFRSCDDSFRAFIHTKSAWEYSDD